jgi:chromate transporter
LCGCVDFSTSREVDEANLFIENNMDSVVCCICDMDVYGVANPDSLAGIPSCVCSNVCNVLKNKEINMIYLKLLYVFLKIGLMGFGGGYAMLSMIQFETVDHFGWLTLMEYSDMLAISQMTPGPVSINMATYVGYTLAGLPGAVVATVSLCLPSVALMFLVIRFLMGNKDNKYIKYAMAGLRPVLGGLILAAALMLFNRESFVDFGIGNYNISVLIFVASFVALYYFKINPILLIVLSGVIGVVTMA